MAAGTVTWFLPVIVVIMEKSYALDVKMSRGIISSSGNSDYGVGFVCPDGGGRVRLWP